MSYSNLKFVDTWMTFMGFSQRRVGIENFQQNVSRSITREASKFSHAHRRADPTFLQARLERSLHVEIMKIYMAS